MSFNSTDINEVEDYVNSTTITITTDFYNVTQTPTFFGNESESSTSNWTTTTDVNEFMQMTTTDGNITEENEPLNVDAQQILQFWIGVGLSVASSVFIGVSFIIKKKALIRLSHASGKRANQGGYGYLKDLLWWAGLLSMAVGEAANFMAYTFAPASLVSTLGVLSVLVTAVLSSRCLHERLNFLGKMGCFLCTIGATVIVIHAPMEKDIDSMLDLQYKLTNIIFVSYVIATIVISLILIYHFRPKLPETSTYTLLIWIGVCSMIGSLSVMSVKGLGLALMLTITGVQNEMGNWLTWFCVVTLVICVSVQMNFLNKALDTFNTAVVTPIYYVFFTSCVILASAILFNEFAYLPVKDWVGLLCGFFTVLTAIVLLHLCKNFDFTLVNLTQQLDFVNNSTPVTEKAHAHNTQHGHHYTTSCGIPVREDFKATAYGFDKKCDDYDQDSNAEDEIYKSLDSCNSRMKESLTPDVKLLSGSGEGRRNREGYIPLSYGTNDNNYSHKSDVV